MTATAFRNVDVDPGSDPDDWPFEAIHTAIDRGSLGDWRHLAASIRRQPWGPCARAVEAITGWGEHEGVDALLAEAVRRARRDVDTEARRAHGERLRTARTAAGLSLRELAPLIGTSAQRLSAYETGRTAPTVHVLGRLDHVLRSRSPRP